MYRTIVFTSPSCLLALDFEKAVALYPQEQVIDMVREAEPTFGIRYWDYLMGRYELVLQEPFEGCNCFADAVAAAYCLPSRVVHGKQRWGRDTLVLDPKQNNLKFIVEDLRL